LRPCVERRRPRSRRRRGPPGSSRLSPLRCAENGVRP
jgi:hypothetical protein